MQILNGRHAADHKDQIVIFVIGMRINHFLKFGRWMQVSRAMGPMIRELVARPDSGFLGAERMLQPPRGINLIQYWRDFDSLESYARDRDGLHWPAWREFNKAIGNDGSVGIFHETYVVEPGGFETIYANMPAWGLGKVAGLVPATGSRNEARSRMKASAGKAVS